MHVATYSVNAVYTLVVSTCTCLPGYKRISLHMGTQLQGTSMLDWPAGAPFPTPAPEVATGEGKGGDPAPCRVVNTTPASTLENQVNACALMLNIWTCRSRIQSYT